MQRFGYNPSTGTISTTLRKKNGKSTKKLYIQSVVSEMQTKNVGRSHTKLNGDPIVFQYVQMDVNAMGMKRLKFGDDTLLSRMSIFIRITECW